jgi:hypothetical protein
MTSVTQTRPGRPPVTRYAGDDTTARAVYTVWCTTAPRGTLTELVVDGVTAEAEVSAGGRRPKAARRAPSQRALPLAL